VALDYRELGPAFGAAIELDLRAPLTADQIAALRGLYDSHHLLVFRGQDLTDDQHVAFVGHFGNIISEGSASPVHYVSNVNGEGTLGQGEILFHSDLAFSPEPFTGLCLYGYAVEHEKSSTRFADAVGAVGRLPSGLRQRLDGLSAINALDFDMTVPGRPLGSTDDDRVRTTWPAIRTHPGSGQRLVFVNQLHTVLFDGLTRDETTALLAEVFDVLYAPTSTFEHCWREGDLVLWDNLAVQHARGDVSEVGRRSLRRVVTGTRSFQELHGDAFATAASHADIPLQVFAVSDRGR
jgi:taurine dioxygenase